MATQLSIVNRALALLGITEISSLQQDVPQAKLALSAWSGVVDYTFRLQPWSFAQVWATLAQSAKNPPFGYSYSYALPDDAVAIIDVRPDSYMSLPGVPFSRVGRFVYTDIRPCNCRYISNLISPGDWSPDFGELVAIRLAIELTQPLVPNDLDVASYLDKKFLTQFSLATLADGHDSNDVEPNAVLTNRFIQARDGNRGPGVPYGGALRDAFYTSEE